MSIPRSVLVLLVVLNAIVLLGLVWPEGAPPFARVVDVVTLSGNIAVFVASIIAGRRTSDRASR